MKAAIGVLISVVSINTFAATGVSGQFGTHDGGQDQRREEMAIAVVDASGPVTGAKCSLTNDKGNWTVAAPDTVRITRSKSDLKIECLKDGYNAVSGVLNASTTQITPKHFQFSAESGGDDGGPVTVPQYAPAVTVTLPAKPSA
jgi:hypothetical protein